MKRVKNRTRELLAVKSRREGRRLSMSLVAAETGIAQNTLERYGRQEVERYDMSIVLRLCEYLGISIGEFFVVEEVEDESTPENKTALLIPA